MAINRQPGERGYAAGITFNAVTLYCRLAIVVTAAVKAKPTTLGKLITQRRGNIDDTASGIAVLNRRWPPDDLDSLGRIQINGIDLGLAVRERVGDAINLNANTTNAKGRPGPESSGG